MKVMAVGSSEMLVNIYEASLRHMPEDRNLHSRRHENLKPHILHLITGFYTSVVENRHIDTHIII
jgi:hypothetical protein